MATAMSRKSPARRRWIRILTVVKSVPIIAREGYEKNNQTWWCTSGGVGVTVGRVVYGERKEREGGDRNNFISIETTCYLGNFDCLHNNFELYKVGSDEAVSDRLTFCLFLKSLAGFFSNACEYIPAHSIQLNIQRSVKILLEELYILMLSSSEWISFICTHACVGTSEKFRLSLNDRARVS